MVMVLSLLLVAAVPVAAEEEVDHGSGDSRVTGAVNEYYGSFGTEVPIVVPHYHGLEPTVKLVYNSTNGNGILGVGWELAASSTIRRGTAPGGGTPRYNNGDTFYLDGQELVPDNSMGGHYSTRIKNYSRIKKNITNNRWYVYGTNGNKATYKPVYSVGSGFHNVYYWGLESIRDTHGNTVNYYYWCDPGKDCYLDRIVYNRTVVKFYYEGRPDHINFGNGRYMGKTRYRVRSIAVKVNGQWARAYKLHYRTSGTGQSLLAWVKQYGRNVSIDGSGNISGGSSLPAMQFSYSPERGHNYYGSPISEGAVSGSTTVLDGDFNGDGRTDLFFWEWNPNYGGINHFYLGRSNGTFGHWGNNPIDPGRFVIHIPEIPDPIGPAWKLTGDFNGDGLSDLVSLWDEDGTNRFHISNGDGSFTHWSNPIPKGRIDDDPDLTLVGDFNGDGLSDLFTYWEGSGTNRFHLSNGNGTFTYWDRPIAGGSIDQASRVLVGDFNGDGRSDLFTYWAGSGLNRFHLSNGNGTFTYWNEPISKDQIKNSRLTSVGDFNGDGLSDVFSYWNNGTNRFHLSHGDNSFSYWNNPISKTAVDENADLIRIGDFDGNGLADLLFYWEDNGRNRFYLSRGNATFEYWGSPHNEESVDYANKLLVGDYDGDGISDQFFFWKNSGCNRFFLTQGPPPNLLTSVANGIGGSTTINYTPSSAWNNTMLPPGMILQTVTRLRTCDGRGHCDTINYSYYGGLWSWAERRFLGFRKVTAVLASDGSYTQTYYWQSEGSTSKPEATYFRNSAGKIYSYSKYIYQENNNPPYTSNLIRRWNYQCNLTNTCWRGRTDISYDVYANVIQTREWGDYDMNGDERTTVRGYRPNTTKHITALPVYENVYRGIGTGGALLKRTRYIYDNAGYNNPPQRGDVTDEQRWLNTNNTYMHYRFGYDARGNVVSETDPRGKVTTHTYDGTYHVYKIKTCNPDNHCATQAWDYVIGQVTSAVDANGTRVNSDYDPLGRKIRETLPHNNAVVRIQYQNWGDPNQQRVRTIEPDGTGNGLWTDTYRDGLGRVYLEVHEGGDRVQTVYSGNSERVWKRSLPYNPGAGESPRWTVHTYDGALRPRETFNPDGTKAEKVYGIDGNGKPYVAHYDEQGHQTVTWRDAYGHLTQVREKKGGAYYYTTYKYDVLGRVTRSVDHAGNILKVFYDSLGRKTKMIDPNMGTWTYVYDNAGNLTRQTDARGQAINFSYDNLGRPHTKTYPNGSKVRWFYDESGHGDSVGRLTRKTYPGGSESYTYDQQGNITESTRCVDGVCKTMQTTYDKMDRVTRHTYPDGENVNYAYDNEGRVKSASGVVNNITYNSRGQIELLTYANGTQTEYHYNINRAWLNWSRVKKGGTNLYQANYTYYADGLVHTQNSPTNPLSTNLTYTYDHLNRLTGVSGGQSESYGYNAIGNVTSKTGMGSYSYGAGSAGPHAVTSAGGNSYSYDANGNMTGGAGRSLTWNVDNMLAAVSYQGTTTQYTYDGGEGRIKKVVGGSDVTRYFGMVEEHNGTLIKYYSVGDLLVARKVQGDSREWYHSDRLGSITMMTNASGNKIKGYDYTPFGEFAGQSGNSDNDTTYTGHRYDAESGLIYMGARYYDPELGRFISPDIIIPDPGNPQALNRYSYVYNNPVNNTDPTGHAPVVAAVASVAIGAATGVLAGAMLAVAVIGAACTVAGYALKSPALMSIGAVLSGYVSGGALGATVAGLASPVSPLDPGVKQAIGWAYTAYGVIQSMTETKPQSQQQDPAGYLGDDNLRPDLIASGEGGGFLPRMYPSKEGAMDALAAYSNGDWTIQVNIGRGLAHSETHLFFNGGFAGSLQGNFMGAGFYDGWRSVSTPITNMIPVTSQQVALMVDKAYSYHGPWGLAWICHDVTRGVMKVIGRSAVLDGTAWSANGVWYLGAHVIGKPGALGTSITTDGNWLLGPRQWHTDTPASKNGSR